MVLDLLLAISESRRQKSSAIKIINWKDVEFYIQPNYQVWYKIMTF